MHMQSCRSNLDKIFTAQTWGPTHNSATEAGDPAGALVSISGCCSHRRQGSNNNIVALETMPCMEAHTNPLWRKCSRAITCCSSSDSTPSSHRPDNLACCCTFRSAGHLEEWRTITCCRASISLHKHILVWTNVCDCSNTDDLDLEFNVRSLMGASFQLSVAVKHAGDRSLS